jgi:hypothetical protein
VIVVVTAIGTHPIMIVLPVLVLTELTAVFRFVATGACFQSFATAIPAILEKKQNKNSITLVYIKITIDQRSPATSIFRNFFFFYL